MATLTIKNLPDSLYERLKARASENRRSINSEAILAVERAVAGFGAPEPEEVLASLRRARARIDRVFLKDEALTAARNSGRA
jgi:plasmid stability protein